MTAVKYSINTARSLPAIAAGPSLGRRLGLASSWSRTLSSSLPSSSLSLSVRYRHSPRSRGFATSSIQRESTSLSSSSLIGVSPTLEASVPTLEASVAVSLDISHVLASEANVSFLDSWVPTVNTLAETLHLPGPYSHALSIVVLAFTARTLFTLPMTLWQRRRTLRMTQLVVPEWNQIKEKAPLQVRARCRKAGKSFQEFQVELKKDMKQKLKVLVRKHNCAPLPTLLAPLAVHLPVFFLITALIRQVTLDPATPFATELLAWWSPPAELAAQLKATASILAERGLDQEMISRLNGTHGGPTLVDSDKTMVGPIGLGMLTLANVELNSWSRRIMTKAALENNDHLTANLQVAEPSRNPNRPRPSSPSPPSVKQLNRNEPEQEPRRSRILTNALRILAIGFIPIASQAPGALIVYWLSSGLYSMIQNTVFAVIDRKRETRKLVEARQLKMTTR